MAKEGITPRDKDYSQWYLDIVEQAELAENSGVRGCMVIKPHGYAIWERIRDTLDERIKATGHVNAYFPLLRSRAPAGRSWPSRTSYGPPPRRSSAPPSPAGSARGATCRS